MRPAGWEHGIGHHYGDIVPTGIVDVDDIVCELAAFANPPDCPNADIAPCGGNGVFDVDDILAVLAAFSGESFCPGPCGQPNP